MARHVEHPEAHLARIEARAAVRNEAIRKTCATPGFGYLVLMFRRRGLGSTRYDVETYAEAKVIVDREIKNKDYEDGALILKKTYNRDMMLGGDIGTRPPFRLPTERVDPNSVFGDYNDDDLLERDSLEHDHDDLGTDLDVNLESNPGPG